MDKQDRELVTLLYRAASNKGKAVAHTVPVYSYICSPLKEGAPSPGPVYVR